MSCDVAVAAFLMFASAGPGGGSVQPAVAAAPAVPPSVAGEPLFQNIVSRAARLKAETEAFRKAVGQSANPAAAPQALPGLDDFSAQIDQLAALDEQGHQELVARGAVDDLKCILHGISQDLPVKLNALKDAKSGHDEDMALRDMSYLLNDNVEVITAPPQPAA
ncbi:MAG: hypothetical protein JO303_13185 [Caulobacteraceae bacterium]|nr:hypothetical protein [Caulobacteraceae bacterium]